MVTAYQRYVAQWRYPRRPKREIYEKLNTYKEESRRQQNRYTSDMNIHIRRIAMISAIKHEVLLEIETHLFPQLVLRQKANR